MLTCHVQGICSHDNLPVDTPDDRHTSNREESDESNPLRHTHLHLAEDDYWDGEECEVEEAMDYVEGETKLSDPDTFLSLAISLQIQAFHKGTALEQLEKNCRDDE